MYCLALEIVCHPPAFLIPLYLCFLLLSVSGQDIDAETLLTLTEKDFTNSALSDITFGQQRKLLEAIKAHTFTVSQVEESVVVPEKVSCMVNKDCN